MTSKIPTQISHYHDQIAHLNPPFQETESRKLHYDPFLSGLLLKSVYTQSFQTRKDQQQLPRTNGMETLGQGKQFVLRVLRAIHKNRQGNDYSKNPHIRTYSYGISLINFLLAIHYLAKCCIGR